MNVIKKQVHQVHYAPPKKSFFQKVHSQNNDEKLRIMFVGFMMFGSFTAAKLVEKPLLKLFGKETYLYWTLI